MLEARLIMFLIIWPIFIIGYGGGILYGLRFLRIHDMIDTRVPEYTKDMLFGNLGYNYKLFYYAHSQKHGKLKTILLMMFHLVSIPMVFVTPIILLG